MQISSNLVFSNKEEKEKPKVNTKLFVNYVKSEKQKKVSQTPRQRKRKTKLLS